MDKRFLTKEQRRELWDAAHPDYVFENPEAKEKRLLRKRKKEEKREAMERRFHEKALMTAKRAEQIYELRKEKKSYTEIGTIMGITRERVRQIGVKLDPEKAVLFHGYCGEIRQWVWHKHVCKQCKEPFASRLKNAVYCSREHSELHRRKYINLDGSMMTATQKLKWRWHNEPGFKERKKKYMREWVTKKKKDPVWKKQFMDKQKVHVRNFLTRKKHENVMRGVSTTDATPRRKSIRS